MRSLLLVVVALLSTTQAVRTEQVPFPVMSCENPMEITEKQLRIELDYFSRNFDKKHYNAAMTIYKELKAQGENPQLYVQTWELYDKAFTWDRVRRYDLVQQEMDMIQHFEDNLNENFSNQQHADNFIAVCKAAELAINTKYHDGEFSDPANFDPEEEVKPKWNTVKFDETNQNKNTVITNAPATAAAATPAAGPAELPAAPATTA